ncbi:unnamed protein product [Arctogadus glacialis]
MTLNKPREKEPLQRRSSPALLEARSSAPHPAPAPQRGHASQRGHAPLGLSSSYQLGDTVHWDRWLSDEGNSYKDFLYRVLLLGDHGVGKSSLAGIFGGVSNREESPGVDHYERTLTVDGEETTLVVMDTWEPDKLEEEDVMKKASAYLIVYSITDRSSFESASELRIRLRRLRQADDIPIILVGNKSDLVRSRDISTEEGRACAVMFDCKFIETSACLHHHVGELFQGVVRQIRLRRQQPPPRNGGPVGPGPRDGGPARSGPPPLSLAKKARRFLGGLAARNNQHLALKARSKSCHDLSVL